MAAEESHTKLLLVIAFTLLAFSRGGNAETWPTTPPQSAWPAPLVEVALHGDANEIVRGFMTSYAKGILKLSELANNQSRQFKSNEIKSLRFVPAPSETLDADKVVETGEGLVDEADQATSSLNAKEPPLDPEKATVQTDRGRDKKWKGDRASDHTKKDLSAVERERLKELKAKGLVGMTREERLELQQLLGKAKPYSRRMEMFRAVHREVMEASQKGTLRPLVKRYHQDLKAAKNAHDIVRPATALKLIYQNLGYTTEQAWSALRRDLETHVRDDLKPEVKKILEGIREVRFGRPKDGLPGRFRSRRKMD